MLEYSDRLDPGLGMRVVLAMSDELPLGLNHTLRNREISESVLSTYISTALLKRLFSAERIGKVLTMNLLPFERVAEPHQRHTQIAGIDILGSQGSAVVVSTSSVYVYTPPIEPLFSNTVTEKPSSRRFFRAARPDGPANDALALVALKKGSQTYQR